MKLEGLTTNEINEQMKDVPHYRGCYGIDYVKGKKPNKEEYLCLNLEPSWKNGSH